MQGPQRLRHHVVGPLRVLAARHVVVDRHHVLARDQIAVEERADDDGVVQAGALAQIEHHLGVEVGDRGERDVELAAGELLPDRAEGVDRARDAALRSGVEGQHGDVGALERLLVRPEQRAELLLGGGDDRVVVVRTEHQVDGAVVLPAHMLLRCRRRRDQRRRRRAEQHSLPQSHRKPPLLLPRRRRCRGRRHRHRSGARITVRAHLCPSTCASGPGRCAPRGLPAQPTLTGTCARRRGPPGCRTAGRLRTG